MPSWSVYLVRVSWMRLLARRGRLGASPVEDSPRAIRESDHVPSVVQPFAGLYGVRAPETDGRREDAELRRLDPGRVGSVKSRKRTLAPRHRGDRLHDNPILIETGRNLARGNEGV